MKKIMRLLSVQLWVVLGDMLSVGKGHNKKQKAIYAGVLFFSLMMSGLSFFYSLMIGTGLKMYDSIELLPSMMMAVSCIMGFMTTIFKVKGTIFGFRDYDMVMSLPVSTAVIAASRLIILYVLNFLTVFILMVPMTIAYGILANPEIQYYINSIILLFFIPFLPIVVAALVGTVIAFAASKFKHSNILTMIFTLGFLAFVVIFSFTLKDDGQELVNMSKALTKQINSIYPLARMYTAAVVDYDALQLSLFLAISLAAFMIFTLCVRKVFKKINTIMFTGSYHSNYRLGELKLSSPFRALFRKELRRYFSSTLYVMNTGFGILMLTIGAIALIFVDLNKVLPNSEAFLAVGKLIPVGISFCVLLTCTTASSISLEGKSLWIIKSAPVSPRMVYQAKVAVNLTVIAPALLDAVIIGIALKLSVGQIIVMLLLIAASSVLISLFGLLINLLLPNFNWTSEIVVVKQSAAMLIAVFSAMIYVGIQFLFIALLPSVSLANLSFLLLTVLLDVLLYFIIIIYGEKRYFAL